MARTTIRTEDITASEVTTAKMATDPTNASNLSSGSVPTAQLGNVNTSGLEDDVALLGFKVASNGSLAKYNLVDQTVDDFQDTSGVDASASTNEDRDSSGKYYSGIGSTAITSSTTGGGSSATDGSDMVTTFTSSGTYIIDTAVDHHFLVSAGGGGGGGGQAGHQGGGGGAGGFRTSYGTSGGGASAEAQLALTATTFTVTVGTGGAAGAVGPYQGVSGTDSVVFISGGAEYKRVVGGGYGGGGNSTTSEKIGAAGGSGGGSGSSDSAAQVGGVGTANEGYQGGTGDTATGKGGSGGGAAAVGVQSPGNSTAVGGGAGVASSITGSAVTYSKGGDTYNQGGAGTANTGNGGAGGFTSTTGNAGGTGIVILRRPTTAPGGSADMTLVSTTTAAQAAPTKGDIVLTYTNGAGTTTLDTDVTAEISADGGSTWTALALGSEGSTGSHNIATSHDVTISSTITAPYNMAYRIKTLNQTASKTTRIQAVSLGWS